MTCFFFYEYDVKKKNVALPLKKRKKTKQNPRFTTGTRVNKIRTISSLRYCAKPVNISTDRQLYIMYTI